MKKMSRHGCGGRLLAIVLCALLLAGVLSASGGALAASAKTGSLRVALKADTYARLAKSDKVEFTLYQIGEAAPQTNAGWKINDDLSGYRIIEAATSEELGKAATALAKDIAGKYTGITKSLSGGATVFKGLKAGVYLGVMTKGPSNLAVTPFIVTVPVKDPETKDIQYNYDVTVKAAIATPSPSPTPSPTPETPVGGPTPTPSPTPVPTVEITGHKQWNDEGNRHKTRPSSIEVTLLADGSPVSAKPSWRGVGTDNWTFTFSDLPAVDDSGRTIVYTVDETPVDGYTKDVSGLTITNDLIPREPKEYKHLYGHKVWNRDVTGTGEKPKMPGHITVYLYREGESQPMETRTVTAADNWEYDFGRQPMDDGYGNEYTYTVREETVPGFYLRVDDMIMINTWMGGNTPTTPGGGVPTRKSSTSLPPFEDLTEEEMEDLIDLFGYGTPLWGGLLGTGDITPLYPFIFGGIGLIAVIALVLVGRKKRRKDR